jgi:hypothetical protein
LSEHIQVKYGNLDKIENHYKTFIASRPISYVKTNISNERQCRRKKTLP